MKKTITVSLILLAIMFSTSVWAKENEKNPFDLIWKAIGELQNKVGKLEENNGSTNNRVEYAGVFPNSTSEADIVKNGEFNDEEIQYYKKIVIPKITLSKIPQISLYTKNQDENTWNFENNYGIKIGEGYILVKYAQEEDGEMWFAHSVEYKLVVNY